MLWVFNALGLWVGTLELRFLGLVCGEFLIYLCCGNSVFIVWYTVELTLVTTACVCG